MKNKEYRKYGFLLYYLLRIIYKTMRIEVVKNKKIIDGENYIFGFWHNTLVGASLGLINFSDKRAVLASPSKDGELISVPMERLGFTVVRGSSGKESVKSLLKLLKYAKDGYSIGTPLDGPKGPVYEVKSGMLYLAQKSGRAFVPVGIVFSKKWIFKKTWDKFQMPKPFSKMVCIIGEPIFIEKDSNLEEYVENITNIIFKLEKDAEKILNEQKV